MIPRGTESDDRPGLMDRFWLPRDERQRQVYNEASTLALFLIVGLGLLASLVMLVIAPRTALPYVGTFDVIIIGSLGTAVLYASRQGVDPYSPGQTRRRQNFVVTFVTLLPVTAFGQYVASRSSDQLAEPWWIQTLGTAVGALAGATLLTALPALIRARARRLDNQADPNESD
jgi:hypothetical protein